MVDDNLEHLELCSETLPKDEFYIDVATTPTEALGKLQLSQYNIVVLDYRLPYMSGLDLLAKIRGKGYKMPIVLVSALDDPDLSFKAMKAGASDYIIKKFKYYSTLRERLLDNIEPSPYF
ncbi:MAG: response regulator [Methanomassiliicoccus sp.]|nr:response regulator [Methanomassiliicoccus sp.]